MSTPTLTTDDLYVATIHANPAAVVVLDAHRTYRKVPFASPGKPVYAPDPNGKVLVATFRLWQHPFTHPDVYLDEHADELFAVSLDDAIHGRVQSPNWLLAITLVDRDAIHGLWDDTATHARAA